MLYQITELSDGLISMIIREASRIFNTPNSAVQVISLVPLNVYFIAAKNCKKGMYECLLYRSHLSCRCPCYMFKGICKHSLCVANNENILKDHIEFVLRSQRHSRPCRSGRVKPVKATAGEKGGSHRHSYRPNRGTANSNTSPAGFSQGRLFTEIHHDNRPLIVCQLAQELKATTCRQ